MLKKTKGQIITAGYDWGIQLSFEKTAISFPETARFISQVRRASDVDDVLATLTTEADEVVRVSEKVIQIRLPGEKTEGWPARNAFLDVVRVDDGLKQHLGFILEVPVRLAITRV